MASTVCDSCRNTIPLPLNKSFLRSDYTSTGTEFKEHSQALKADHHLLKHHDTEIVRLSQILKELKQERQKIARRIRLRKGLLSPIRRVPVEIWRRIFSFVCLVGDSICIRSDISDTRSLDSNDEEADEYRVVSASPYQLLRVCAHWFHIVNGFPQLWSSLWITSEFSGMQDIASILQSLLAKSGNSPLTIWFPCIMDHYGNSAIACVKVLAAHAFSRCKHLTVEYPWWKCLIQQSINLSFPILESLDMRWSDTHDTFSKQILDAPLLSRMRISHIHRVPKNIQFPYAQLTHLALQYNVGIVGFLLEVLPLCSKLQSLVTPFYFGDVHIESPNSPLAMPSLQHLQVSIPHFQHDLFCLFKHFEFPKLSSLEMSELYRNVTDSDTAPSPLTHSEYHSSFQRSLSGLQNLTIRLSGVRVEDSSPNPSTSSLQNILAASPSLTSLKLIYNSVIKPTSGIFNSHLQLLTISSDTLMPRDILLPKLTSLFIYTCEFPCFDCHVTTSEKIDMERNILNMVESGTRYSKLSELCLVYRQSWTRYSSCEYRDATYINELQLRMRSLKQYALKWRIQGVRGMYYEDNF